MGCANSHDDTPRPTRASSRRRSRQERSSRSTSPPRALSPQSSPNDSLPRSLSGAESLTAIVEMARVSQKVHVPAIGQDNADGRRWSTEADIPDDSITLPMGDPGERRGNLLVLVDTGGASNNASTPNNTQGGSDSSWWSTGADFNDSSGEGTALSIYSERSRAPSHASRSSGEDSTHTPRHRCQRMPSLPTGPLEEEEREATHDTSDNPLLPHRGYSPPPVHSLPILADSTDEDQSADNSSNSGSGSGSSNGSGTPRDGNPLVPPHLGTHHKNLDHKEPKSSDITGPTLPLAPASRFQPRPAHCTFSRTYANDGGLSVAQRWLQQNEEMSSLEVNGIEGDGMLWPVPDGNAFNQGEDSYNCACKVCLVKLRTIVDSHEPSNDALQVQMATLKVLRRLKNAAVTSRIPKSFPQELHTTAKTLESHGLRRAAAVVLQLESIVIDFFVLLEHPQEFIDALRNSPGRHLENEFQTEIPTDNDLSFRGYTGSFSAYLQARLKSDIDYCCAVAKMAFSESFGGQMDLNTPQATPSCDKTAFFPSAMSGSLSPPREATTAIVDY